MFGVRQSLVIGGATTFIGLLVAALFLFSPFESDLSNRSQAALNDAGHTWASVSLTGREAVVTGLAPSPEARSDAFDTVQTTYGVRTATDEMELLPEERPFVTSYERAGTQVTVTGSLPSEDSKKALGPNIVAAIDGAELSDLTSLARGAPDDYAASTEFTEKLLGLLEPATITLTDGTIDISGDAIDFDAFDAFNAALANEKPAGLEIANANVRAPRVSPFTWSASIQGDQVQLDGFVPDAELAEELEIKMKEFFPAAQVESALRPARGLPDGVDFEGIATYALERIAELGTGRADLSDTTLTVTGRAKDPGAYDRAIALMDESPSDGFVLTGTDIKRPLIEPYTFKIEELTSSYRMTGYLPYPEAKGRVLDNANLAALKRPIEDETQFADGAPDNFEALATYAINRVPFLDQGSIELSGTAVSINGEAFHEGARDRLTSLVLSDAPEGFDIEANVAIKEAVTDLDDQSCVLELGNVLSTSTIQFETASARIDPQSFALLDNIVFLTRRCPDTRFEVAGHTDSDGADQANQRLSEQRASAVAAFLIEAGTPEDRLFPVGYGESQPIASNDTAQGKAQNRRIEFSLYVPPPPEDTLLPEDESADQSDTTTPEASQTQQ